jgi:cytidyltransferase-like protein
MTVYRAYAGGTFDLLHDGHLFYLRLVKDLARSIFEKQPDFEGLELIVFVSADIPKGAKNELPYEKQTERMENIRAHPLLQGEYSVNTVVPLTGSFERDLELRASMHTNPDEKFVYFFGDDQYSTEWAKKLRDWLEENYKNVMFHWVDYAIARDRLSSSNLREQLKKAKPVNLAEEGESTLLSREGIMEDFYILTYEHAEINLRNEIKTSVENWSTD